MRALPGSWFWSSALLASAVLGAACSSSEAPTIPAESSEDAGGSDAFGPDATAEGDAAADATAPSDGALPDGSEVDAASDAAPDSTPPVDAGPPPPTANSVSLRDDDPRKGIVSGPLKIGRAADESNIASYDIYFGSNALTKLGNLVVSVPKTGADIDLLVTYTPPLSATHLLVFTKSPTGVETLAPVALSSFDAYARYFDVADATQRSAAFQPRLSTVVDAVGQKVLLLGYSADNSRKLELNRCNFDGTGCSFTILTSAAGSGVAPAAVIDTSASKLVAVVEDSSGVGIVGKVSLVRCNLDGTSCTQTALTASGLPTSATGGDPSVAIDSENDKLLIGTMTGAGTPALLRCNLDGTGCTWRDLTTFVGAPSTSFTLAPSLAIDPVSDRVVMGVHDGNKGHLTLVTCTLDLATCGHQDVSQALALGDESGQTPSLAYEATTTTLFVATANGNNGERAHLFRCSWQSGSSSWSCVGQDASLGQGAGSGYGPSVAIDAAHQRVLIVTQNAANALKPALVSCAFGGDDCRYGDISGGSPIDSAYWPSATVSGNTLFVGASLFEPSAAKYSPVFFSWGLR